jgi:hypothetical protein
LKTTKGKIPTLVYNNRNGTSLFFENKDRFVLSDFQKLHHIKTSGEYDTAIADLLNKYPTDIIYYGIGLPTAKLLEKKMSEHDYLIDFVIALNPTFEIEILKGHEIFNTLT